MKFMVNKLEFFGLKQINLDLLLFIEDTVIAVTYVENILIWSTEYQNMIDLTNLLNTEGVDQEEEIILLVSLY